MWSMLLKSFGGQECSTLWTTPFGRRDAFVSEEVVLEIVHDY